jgi:tripartite-type tricarboxylate transporter receptor subunit TctC
MRTVVGALAFSTIAAVATILTPVCPYVAVVASADKPIRVIVSLAAGGPTDAGARLVAKAYTEQTGRTVIVENKAGGGGAIAAVAVKQADPDGSTLLILDNGGCCANGIINKVEYDTLTDFRPVTMLWGYPTFLWVNAQSQIHSLPELVELAKKRPQGLSHGSPGVGTAGHILGAMLAQRAHLSLTHVPYRGVTPAAERFAAGRVDFMFAGYGSVLAFADDGKLTAIAIADDAREAGRFRNLPTTAEAGYPYLKLGAWFMLLAPAATPDGTAQGLSESFAHALRSPDVIARLKELGMGFRTISLQPM